MSIRLVAFVLSLSASLAMAQAPFLWQRELTPIGRPAFGDGMVFVEVAEESPVAIDVATGRFVWRGTGTGRPTGYPIEFEGGRVYRLAADGAIEVLDAGSGRFVTRIVDPAGPFLSAPLVAGDLLLAPMRPETGGRVLAYGREDLLVRWTIEAGSPGDGSGMGADARRLYWAPGDGGLAAYDLATGVRLWRSEYPAVALPGEAKILPPRSIGGAIVVRPPDCWQVMRFDPETGEWLSTAIAATELYFAASGDGRYATCSSGGTVWVWEPGGGGRTIAARAAGDGVFAGEVLLLPTTTESGGFELTAWQGGSKHAALPIDEAGDLFLQGDQLVHVRASRILGCPAASLLRRDEIRSAFRGLIERGKMHGDAEILAQARSLAGSIDEWIEAEMARADALFAADRTAEAVAAWFGLVEDYGARGFRPRPGKSIALAAYVSRRLDVLLGEEDAELVPAYFAPFLRRAEDETLTAEDRRRLQAHPVERLPAELRGLDREER